MSVISGHENVLARAHKKFQRGQHSEIYLLTRDAGTKVGQRGAMQTVRTTLVL